MNIGNKIKQLRHHSGLTQEQLASRLGVSAQSVSKWENAVSMPDITLLPPLAEVFGVSVDELFDLTVEERLRRLENRLEKEEELPVDVFREYEEFLLRQLKSDSNGYKATSLLAHLYHHRMETDARRVQKYAEDAIMLCPEKKDCQWLLNMAAGQRVWDWNVANHAEIIDFWKKVIACDKGEPKTPMPYYYLIDNLLADNRTEEAQRYVAELSEIPACNPILIPTYKAHIALARFDETEADRIIAEGMCEFSGNSAYIFEAAQYYAGKAEYDKAIELYEKCWQLDEQTDPGIDTLEGIATIYSIMGNKEKTIETYGRIISCLKERWGFADDDRGVIEFENKRKKLLN